MHAHRNTVPWPGSHSEPGAHLLKAIQQVGDEALLACTGAGSRHSLAGCEHCLLDARGRLARLPGELVHHLHAQHCMLGQPARCVSGICIVGASMSSMH